MKTETAGTTETMAMTAEQFEMRTFGPEENDQAGASTSVEQCAYIQSALKDLERHIAESMDRNRNDRQFLRRCCETYGEAVRTANLKTRTLLAAWEPPFSQRVRPN